MEKLQNIFSFHLLIPSSKATRQSFSCSYLRQRKIPFQIAKNYCEEVYYDLNGKKFYAIGFKNNSEGYELRNAHFKGSSSPKDVTFIQVSPADTETTYRKNVAVFEGFFSFLSYQTLEQKDLPLTNFLILKFSFLLRKESLNDGKTRDK